MHGASGGKCIELGNAVEELQEGEVTRELLAGEGLISAGGRSKPCVSAELQDQPVGAGPQIKVLIMRAMVGSL